MTRKAQEPNQGAPIGGSSKAISNLNVGIATSSPICIKDDSSVRSFPMGLFNIYLKDKPNFQVYFVRKSRRHILCTQLSIEV